MNHKNQSSDYKQTEIGVIPEEWEVKELRDVCAFRNGVAHENIENEYGKYSIINSKFISSEGLVIRRTDIQLCPLFKEEITIVMSDIPNGKALAKCFYVMKMIDIHLINGLAVLKLKSNVLCFTCTI